MHQCFLIFTRWSQTSRSSRTGAECSRHRDNHMGSISWRETGRPSALHGDEEGLHQADVADGGWPFVQQQIHSYQHLARKRIQLQSVREERYRPFRAICVSSLGNNKKEGFVDRFIVIIACSWSMFLLYDVKNGILLILLITLETYYVKAMKGLLVI